MMTELDRSQILILMLTNSLCRENTDTCCVCRDFLRGLNLRMVLVDCFCDCIFFLICISVGVISRSVECIALMTLRKISQNVG